MITQVLTVVGLLAGGVTSYVALMSRITTLEVKNANLENEIYELKKILKDVHSDTQKIMLDVAKIAK